MDDAKLSVLNRANIYNDDEFDVFSSTQYVNANKVHRGKMKKGIAEHDNVLKEKVGELSLCRI